MAMDEWTSNKLPERLPFSKKRLPKRVILSCVHRERAGKTPTSLTASADISLTMSLSCTNPRLAAVDALAAHDLLPKPDPS